jgi:hypothetical protein
MPIMTRRQFSEWMALAAPLSPASAQATLE